MKIILIIILVIATINCERINESGLKLIEEFEGFSPNFYNDPAGIKTIGYGHACHVNDCSKIKAPISRAQGEELLRQDLNKFEKCVSDNTNGLNSDQFSALVSFSYNLGCGALKKSTLLKHVKAGNFKAAANEFPRWNKAGGKVLAGLTRRRNAEKALFCKSGGC